MDHTIIFLIYIISVSSVLFCIWIRWEQDANAGRMTDIEKHHEELKKQMQVLDQELKRIDSPFKK